MTSAAPEPPVLPDPPVTGHHEIDRALARLSLPPDVADHAEPLAATLEAVQAALSGPAVPPVLRPH